MSPAFCSCGNAGPQPLEPGRCQPCWIQRWHPAAVPPVQHGRFRSTLEKARPNDKMARLKTPCVHRTAKPARIINGCGRCPVYGCAQHGECMTGANGYGLRSCVECADYATDRPSWPIRFDETNLAPGRKGKRFNSSIIAWGDGYVLAYRDGWRGSEIWTIQLDREFRPHGDPILADMRQTINRRLGWRCPGCNFGREDPRLFLHHGQLHLAFIGVEGRRGGSKTNQCFARLRDDRTVDDAWQTNVPNRREWEKNHSFFEHEGDLYAVYLTHPHHVIVKVDCSREVIVHNEPNPFPWGGGELRGGTPPIRVGGEYWSFIHEHVMINDCRFYSMLLYTFDAKPPFAPRRMTPKPILVADWQTKPADTCCCVFPCGAVHVGDDWVVSMGIHDRWTELRKYSHADLERQLEEAPAPRVPATVNVPSGLVSVTIGVGDKFRDLAAQSAASVRKFYGVENSIILDERHLESCPAPHLFRDDPRRIFWLKWLIAQFFPNVERYLYHDADYRAVRTPSDEALEAMRTDPRLIAVRDWWENPPTDPYFNAGFFVANRSHDVLFDWCKANYWKTPEKFGDQCVMNSGIQSLAIPVLEFPREFNVGKPEQHPDPFAKHGYW